MSDESLTAFCPRCGVMREMADAEPLRMPAGGAARGAVKGICPTCGSPLFKILEDDPAL